MKICYVSPEFFAWGTHGGFGYLTRTLSTGLAERGIDVCVVTPRRKGQPPVEWIDEVKVIGYEPYTGYPHLLKAFASRAASLGSYREADADIYHSQAVSYNTIVAQRTSPSKLHIITFQDPYDEREWRRIAKVEPRYRLTPVHRARIEAERRLLSHACNGADALFSQAHFLVTKARKLFNISKPIGFLPNPVPIYGGSVEKSSQPQVCFLARWDPQKRVELFFEQSRMFPDVRFIAMGHSHDALKDHELRERYRDIPNLVLTGFVSEEEKSRILAESWALVNTSIREALPVSFLEALAHETPIISGENPDGLTKKYGYHVTGDDYASAIRYCLEDKDRTRKGREGRRLVENLYHVDKVIDRHIKVYENLLEGNR
ncbi:MAG: glycosyltransferase family 4 protein [Candidatus Bathyarchaeota archaeon]|nr:glycosyltransferase family 4 protein [Candidatus Bathyarchaeota archaeon]